LIALFPTADFSAAPQEVADKTAVAYQVWYGSVNGQRSHIADLGIVPISLISKLGYVWFSLREKPSFGILRDAPQAIRDFWQHNTWTLVAFVECEYAARRRFAEFCGFSPVGEVDGFICYEVK
jgi:hypothetical protein